MSNRWLILAGILVAGLLVLFHFSQNRHFVWDEDTKFLTDDDEPFGSELFDKMAEATLPNGYQVYDGDFEELLSTDKRCALLLLYTFLFDVSDYYAALELFVEKGNKVMLVTNHQGNYMSDETCFEANLKPAFWWGFSKDSLKNVLTGKAMPAKVVMKEALDDTLDIPVTLLGKINNYPDKAKVSSTWDLPEEKPILDDVPVAVKETLAKYEAMADEEDLTPPEEEDTLDVEDVDVSHGVLSYEIQVGKGTVYVVSAPLLFTNYGVLDRNIARYLEYQMGRLSDMPVVRVANSSLNRYNGAHGAYMPDEFDDKSPLDHLLGYPALRWAIYTMLLAAAIFILFTARHRQRVVPVLSKPVNRNMEFVRLLGTIYYRRHDNHDLFLKKYTYFKEELRRTQMIDLDDERVREANARMLAQRTGMEEEDVAKTLELLKAVAASGDLDNTQLQECVQKIDNLIGHL